MNKERALYAVQEIRALAMAAKADSKGTKDKYHAALSSIAAKLLVLETNLKA